MTATGAEYTANTKANLTIRGFDIAFVITMDRKTARVSTRTGKSVELKAGDKIIIK